MCPTIQYELTRVSVTVLTTVFHLQINYRVRITLAEIFLFQYITWIRYKLGSLTRCSQGLGPNFEREDPEDLDSMITPYLFSQGIWIATAP
jgi:hypothetical protein